MFKKFLSLILTLTITTVTFGFYSQVTKKVYPVNMEYIRENHINKDLMEKYLDQFKSLKISVIEDKPFIEPPAPVKLASRGKIMLKPTKQFDLREKSGLTSDDINRALEGKPLAGMGQTFLEAESRYGINALFLLSLAILESGWGKSTIAKTKNNLFGFGAFDGDTNNAKKFRSKEECVFHVAEYLSKHYLSEDGKHFNGFTVDGVNVKYSSSDKWAGKVVFVMNYVIKKMERRENSDSNSKH